MSLCDQISDLVNPVEAMSIIGQPPSSGAQPGSYHQLPPAYTQTTSAPNRVLKPQLLTGINFNVAPNHRTNSISAPSN